MACKILKIQHSIQLQILHTLLTVALHFHPKYLIVLEMLGYEILQHFIALSKFKC